MRFVYGTITLFGSAFLTDSTRHWICNSVTGLVSPPLESHNPIPATPPGFDTGTVWALPVSLAATQGVTVVFLSSGYLDVSIHPVPSPRPIHSGGCNTS